MGHYDSPWSADYSENRAATPRTSQANRARASTHLAHSHDAAHTRREKRKCLLATLDEGWAWSYSALMRHRAGRIAAILFVLVLLEPVQAYAVNYFGGRYVKSVAGVNGSKTTINYSSVNSSNACVFFGNAITGTGRQLEIGIYSCGSGYTFDTNACGGGPNRFVEYLVDGAGTCYIYASATSGTSYPVQVIGSTPSYTSYFNGSPFGFLSGFPATVWAGTWLEAFTNGLCSSWAATVTFNSWNYRTGSTWHAVTSATPTANCTTIGGLSGSGTWTATHV